MKRLLMFIVGISVASKKRMFLFNKILCLSFLLGPLVSHAAVFSIQSFRHNTENFYPYAFNLRLDSINANSTIPIDCEDGCIALALVQSYAGDWIEMKYSDGTYYKPFLQENLKARTVGELESQYSSWVGHLSPGLVARLIDSGSCVVLGYSTSRYGSEAIPLPGSPCTAFPLTNTKCNLDSKALIDYGTVNLNDIEGNKRDIDLNIKCDGETSAKFSLDSTSLDLSGGIKSELSISKENINMKPNELAVLTVTSVLHSSGGVVAGRYANSAILYVSWY